MSETASITMGSMRQVLAEGHALHVRLLSSAGLLYRLASQGDDRIEWPWALAQSYLVLRKFERLIASFSQGNGAEFYRQLRAARTDPFRWHGEFFTCAHEVVTFTGGLLRRRIARHIVLLWSDEEFLDKLSYSCLDWEDERFWDDIRDSEQCLWLALRVQQLAAMLPRALKALYQEEESAMFADLSREAKAERGLLPAAMEIELARATKVIKSEDGLSEPGGIQTPPPRHEDGLEGGRWLWWQGKRHDIPGGVVYRLLAFMWGRDTARYDELGGPTGAVFDETVNTATVRARVSEANKVLSRIGVPWRLHTDAQNRVLTKQSLPK